MMNCSPDLLIVNKPPIDCIFFQYIKYVSNIINKEYVVFILKFIIIFRQYINIEKKQSINIDYIDSLIVIPFKLNTIREIKIKTFINSQKFHQHQIQIQVNHTIISNIQ